MEILSRIAQTTAALVRLKLVWNDRNISLSSKILLMPSLCHIHHPVCLWIMDSHSRAAKKNTSHGNEVLPHDTAHLIQRPCYQRGRPCHDPSGNWTTRRPPDDCKEMQTCSGMVMTPVHQIRPKPSCKAQWKWEEDKADRERGGKTTSGNGQAVSYTHLTLPTTRMV